MNRHRMKFRLVTVSVAFLMLFSAACAGSGKEAGGGEDSGKGAGREIHLRIMWWGPTNRHEATLKALDLYTQQNPGIKFTPEYLAWDGYWNKLTTLAASKSMTDILQMDGAYIQDYVSRGTLEDLSDVDLKGIVDPKIIEYLKIDGKLYGIPLSHNGEGLAFNKADLEAAGVTLPAKGWTWDDFFSFAREARQQLPEGKYPILDGTNNWGWYQYYQTANGKGPVMLDGTKFNLDKDLWFEFQNIYAEFRKEGIVPPAEVQAAFVDSDPQGDPVASGTVMVKGGTVASVGVLESLLPGKIDVVNIPYGPAGGGWAQSTIFWSISANSKYKKEAKDFVRWFITDKEAGKLLGMTRGIPIYEEIYKEIEPTLQPQDLLGKRLLDAVSDKALPFYPAPPGWSEWVQAYGSELEAVMFGQKTLEEAYKNIETLGKDTEAKLAGK